MYAGGLPSLEWFRSGSGSTRSVTSATDARITSGIVTSKMPRTTECFLNVITVPLYQVCHRERGIYNKAPFPRYLSLVVRKAAELNPTPDALSLSVIPAQAGIQWHQAFRDSHWSLSPCRWGRECRHGDRLSLRSCPGNLPRKCLILHDTSSIFIPNG